MKNTLEKGDYTVIFETLIILHKSILNDETLITNVYGDDNFNIITFSHDYQTTYSKVYIQFTSNGKAGQILRQQLQQKYQILVFFTCCKWETEL